MTTTPERTATLTSLVAAEIRAWMGRLDVRQSELARRMGETDQWMSMRLKGRTPIDLNELQRIGDALGISIVQLLPASVRSSQSRNSGTTSGTSDLNASSGRTVRSVEGRPARRRSTDRRADTPTIHTGSPLDHQRHDSRRPVSAPAAASRRPQRIGPGARPMAS